uniref:Serpentine receptor class gamma n=1 Tax=Caenorhabditis tropicalis TaxID=1561998 RepID=A0A1I7U3V1_9PELO
MAKSVAQIFMVLNRMCCVMWPMTYDKASLSVFQSIFIMTALCFTVICTSISVYKLYILPDRVKTAEKSLCLVSAFYSLAFLVVTGSQLVFVFCASCLIKQLIIFQFLAFDLLTVGSAVIIISTSSQLSKNLWFIRNLTKTKKTSEAAVKMFTSVNSRSITN